MKLAERIRKALRKEVKQQLPIPAPTPIRVEGSIVLPISRVIRVFERLPFVRSHPSSKFNVTFEKLRSKGNPSGMIEEYERVAMDRISVYKMYGTNEHGQKTISWAWQGIVTTEPEVIDEPKQLPAPNDQF